MKKKMFTVLSAAMLIGTSGYASSICQAYCGYYSNNGDFIFRDTQGRVVAASGRDIAEAFNDLVSQCESISDANPRYELYVDNSYNSLATPFNACR